MTLPSRKPKLLTALPLTDTYCMPGRCGELCKCDFAYRSPATPEAGTDFTPALWMGKLRLTAATKLSHTGRKWQSMGRECSPCPITPHLVLWSYSFQSEPRIPRRNLHNLVCGLALPHHFHFPFKDSPYFTSSKQPPRFSKCSLCLCAGGLLLGPVLLVVFCLHISG